MPTVGTQLTGPAIPKGGTTDQILVKDIGSNPDVSWQTPPPVEYSGPIHFSGQWCSTAAAPVAATSSISVVAKSVQYYYMYMNNPTTVNGLGVRISSGAATTGSFGISAMSSTTGMPGQLLYSTTFDASVVGAVTSTIPAAGLALPAGWFLYSVGNTGSTAYSLAAMSYQSYRCGPVCNTATPTSGGNVVGFNHLSGSGSTGFPVSDPSGPTSYVSATLAAFWYRVA